MRAIIISVVPVITSIVTVVASTAGVSPAASHATTPAAVTLSQTEVPPGRAPFTRVCAACHGDNAEGNQGPRLAGIAIEYEEFLAKVRHSGGEMPSMSKTQITDEEVKLVFDYLTKL
jgi:mono/diheme cytochrome c family protein